MAIDEKLCWAVLHRLHGHVTTMRQTMVGLLDQEHKIENGVSIGKLESELVLQFSKSAIEDSLYFLEKRDYLLIHGYGMMSPRMAYSLTQKALDTLQADKFTDEEQQAFRDALFDVSKPGWFGMKFNLSELRRRYEKSKKSDKNDDGD